jgi:biopolymer transport protein ExbD
VDRKRALGLTLSAVALALIVWGLIVAVRVDFPPATPAPPKKAKPVTISIDGNGAVHVREGAPSSLEPPSGAVQKR